MSNTFHFAHFLSRHTDSAHIDLVLYSIPYFRAATSLAQKSPVLSLCLPLLLCRAVPAVSEETKQKPKHVWCVPLRHIANGLWILKEEKELEWYLPNYFLSFPPPPWYLRNQIFLMFSFYVTVLFFSFVFLCPSS